MNNCVIQELLVFGNDIGVKGACVILQSAVNNEACQANIYINNEHRRDIEVQKLMNIMVDRRRMKKN